MNIPYTSTARPDSGLYNAKLGVWLFLASEVMLFGALFSSYVLLRVSAETWPHGYSILNVPLATLNTVVLISSSVTMVMSWASLMMNDFKKYKRYMGLTVLAGFGFLIIKGFEYGAKFSHGISPADRTFMAIYFTLTGLQGLHVIGDLCDPEAGCGMRTLYGLRTASKLPGSTGTLWTWYGYFFSLFSTYCRSGQWIHHTQSTSKNMSAPTSAFSLR
jgi:hypothetical protein